MIRGFLCLVDRPKIIPRYSIHGIFTYVLVILYANDSAYMLYLEYLGKLTLARTCQLLGGAVLRLLGGGNVDQYLQATLPG